MCMFVGKEAPAARIVPYFFFWGAARLRRHRNKHHHHQVQSDYKTSISFVWCVGWIVPVCGLDSKTLARCKCSGMSPKYSRHPRRKSSGKRREKWFWLCGLYYAFGNDGRGDGDTEIQGGCQAHRQCLQQLTSARQRCSRGVFSDRYMVVCLA